jgi:hypothetical protein
MTDVTRPRSRLHEIALRNGASLALAPFVLICRNLSHSVLDGKNAIQPGLPETLLVDPLDENPP